MPTLLPIASCLLPLALFLAYYPQYPVVQLLLVSGEGCQAGKRQECIQCQLACKNPILP